MSGTVESLIREKLEREGPNAFRSVSLADFLAESGHKLVTADLVRLADRLADADLSTYLPAVSSALRSIASGDGNYDAEFARLALSIAGRVGLDPDQGPLRDSLVDIGSDRPDLAVSVAKRLVESGCTHQAAFLLGGAWRGATAECWGIAEPLLRSKDGEEVADGIRSMHVAWRRHGVPDEAALFVALSHVAMRHDGAAAAVILTALADIYPKARDVDPLIEYLARRHASCRAALAARICRHSSPFDDATALRYLAICAEAPPDFQTMHDIHMALAGLSERRPADAVKIIVGHLFDERYASAAMGHALQEIGRASPRGLTRAILDKVSAERDHVRDLFLFRAVDDISVNADPEAILDPLFDALDSGDDKAARPALYMINAMVTRNHDITQDAGLAARTLRRLVGYAQARGIDPKRATRTGCGDDLKCSSLIYHLLHPPPRVDGAVVLRNLEGFPVLKKAFKPEWIRAEIAKGDGAQHPVVALLSTISLEKIGKLHAGLPGETTDECFNRLFRLWYEMGPLEIPAFLDRALALFDANKRCVPGYVKKMKNSYQFRDTISEMALVAPFVAGGYEVELEPPVGDKRLDAAIRLGPQRVLFEVLAPRTWEPLKLLEGPRKIPQGRIGSKIFDKVKKQLPAPGTCGDPIVVAVDTSRSEATPDDAETYALGPEVQEVTINRCTGETMDCAVARDVEQCMHSRDPRTDSISAVVCFEASLSCGLSASARGKVVPNPHAKVPLEEAALEALRRVLGGVPPGNDHQEGGAP